MGILEKIAEIEREIARTQKNKGKSLLDFNAHCFQHCYKLYTATEYHLGLLKAKLAKYRSQLLEPSKTGAGKVKNNWPGPIKSSAEWMCI